MKIRPHHLLCIQKFTGHGYNEEFTKHMNTIVSKLKDNANTIITITKGCDALCDRCPNNMSGTCNSLEKVNAMDDTVLSLCDISYGDCVGWQDAAKRAKKRIFETKEFNNICINCQWFGLCSNTEV